MGCCSSCCEDNPAQDKTLCRAAARSDVAAVKKSLAAGANPNTIVKLSGFSLPALSHAVLRSGMDLLLDIDPSLPSSRDEQAQLQTVAAILDPSNPIKADINLCGEGDVAVPALLLAQDAAVVRALIANKAAVDVRDRAGNTALMIAARSGNADVVRVLLEIDLVDVNVENNSGQSATEIAHTVLQQTNVSVCFDLIRAMHIKRLLAVMTDIVGGAETAGEVASFLADFPLKVIIPM